VSDDDTGAGPAPIDDVWEPEPERPPLRERMGGGPVDYFRAVPARFFAWLGAIVFVGGWVAALFTAFSFDVNEGGPDEIWYRVQLLLSNGLQATIAAGILWGVAAFLWVKVLPATPDASPGAA
jgi:hypothetical protein